MRLPSASNRNRTSAPSCISLTTAQHAFLAWLLVTLWLVPLAGCQGCWSSTGPNGKKLTAEEELEEKEKKKKKLAEKPKPDFEILPTIILPNESGQDAEDDGTEKKPSAPKVVFFTKPGHWIAGAQLAKANNFDFQGELRTFPMDQSENPLDVEHTDFRLSLTTPASLPKGVPKRIETMFYLPKRGVQASKNYTLRTELRATRSSRLPEIVHVAGNSLREHEYYMVVLARNPAAYVDLAKLDSVELQAGSDLSFSANAYEQQQVKRFYHAVFPRIDKGVPLPSHPLAWTMIAYIVWDDLDPMVLTERQQTALIDWIHWGGQLVISGPNSLDRLKESFLEPYLPATSGKALQIGEDELGELNEYWSIKSKFQPPRKPEHIVVLKDKPLVGVELQKDPAAEWMPHTGQLVTERQVGNGRIVVSAFSLSAPQYRFWGSRDNFFNACLLRKPSRNFFSPGVGELTMTWGGKTSWALPDDPRIGTRLRYFSRDIGKLATVSVTPATQVSPTAQDLKNVPGVTVDPATTQPPFPPNIRPPIPPSPQIERRVNIPLEQLRDRRFAGYQKDQIAGMAGWNDFSGAADAALAALNDASGIKIPRADFVLKVLVVYLLVLVPLNYLIFWLMGRVEYAWVAAPVIAIVGAMAVIRLAQLDIGFARSRTEIAVLESHADYPRAHVTRYTALYTSLSTSYDLRFSDPDALALPLALDEKHTRPVTRAAEDVVLTQNEAIELSDVQIRSNSTGKVHVEQMISLDKPFRVTGDDTRGWQLENGSQFKLRQAGILRKTEREEEVEEFNKVEVTAGEANDSDVVEENGKFYKKERAIVRRMVDRVEAAYFPDIPPGGTVRLNFERVGKTGENRCWVPQWDNSAMMSSAAPAEAENRVRLHRLSQLAAQQLFLQVGEMRLIAWTDDEIPGLKIVPSAAQSLTYTLVLVHLKNASLPEPESDKTLRTDVLQDEVKSEDEKEVGGE